MEHRQSLLPAILVCGLHASLLVPLAGCEEETTEQAVSVSLSLRPSRLNAALRDADTPFGEQGTLDITVAGLEQGELVILSRSTSGDVVGIRQVGSVVYGTAEAKPPTLLTGLPLRNGVEKVLLVCLEGPDDPAGADLEAEVEVSVWQGAKKLALASQLVRCFYSDPDFYQLSLALEPERQQAGLAIEAKATAFDDAGKVVFNEQLRFSVIGGIVQGQLATEEVTLLQRTGKDGTARIDITCPEASGIGVVEVHYEKELYAEVPGLRKTFSCFSERGDTALEIVSDREEVKADGVSTVRLMLKVLDELGVPQVAVPVMVTVNRGSLQPDPSYRGADEPIFTGPQAMRILTNDEGDASFLLLGGTEAGMARVIARATINPLGGEYSVSLEEEKLINVVGLGSIQFIGVEPPVLGVRGSGHNEQATVRFQVFNHDGKPFPAGTQVSFRIAQQSEVDPQRSHAPHLSPSVAATD
ncbi:MAG: hypothetical protein FJ125_08395, partial [Deltaproteobacteria bacterium]|nr:hypothetical protein [Deltaproteobacteria bacterium]